MSKSETDYNTTIRNFKIFSQSLSDCSGTRTGNHLVTKPTLNHLAKLTFFKMIELCCVLWVLICTVHLLYVLNMPRTHFIVNPFTVAAWMSRNSLLETDGMSDV